jgi:hypothetical protein
MPEYWNPNYSVYKENNNLYHNLSCLFLGCLWPKLSGSVVGIVTGYGLDGLGIESQWGRDFPLLSGPALGSNQPPVQWVPGLSRGQRAVGAWRWPLVPFYCRGHERVELYLYFPFYYRGHERVELYLYFPYGTYGLYRASVPAQGRTLTFTFYSP